MKIKFLAIIAILLLSANFAAAANVGSGTTNLKSSTSELKPEVPKDPKKPIDGGTFPKPKMSFEIRKPTDPEIKGLCDKQFPNSNKDYYRCVKRKTREKQKAD